MKFFVKFDHNASVAQKMTSVPQERALIEYTDCSQPAIIQKPVLKLQVRFAELVEHKSGIKHPEIKYVVKFHSLFEDCGTLDPQD